MKSSAVCWCCELALIARLAPPSELDPGPSGPGSADYDQASQVISSAVQAALRLRETPWQALSEMASQLAQIIQ